MTPILTVTIPGLPTPKGRPRFRVTGRFARAYTDSKTRSYEKHVAECARIAMRGRLDFPLDQPLSVALKFVLPRPKSAAKSVRLPAARPDIDNLTKAVLDGLSSAGVFVNDSRIVALMALKVYGTPVAAYAIVAGATRYDTMRLAGPVWPENLSDAPEHGPEADRAS